MPTPYISDTILRSGSSNTGRTDLGQMSVNQSQAVLGLMVDVL